MKVYVSGPMTGYEDYNRPAFHRATQHLRDLGFTVVNPAELDEADGSAEEIQSHAWYLKRDIAALLTCDAIYLLPGWKHSKGATLEKQVADGCGIFEVIDPDPALWRTFEGEPETHEDCEPVEGDAGTGEAWCDHGVQVREAKESPAQYAEGGYVSPPEGEDLSAHPQWGGVTVEQAIEGVERFRRNNRCLVRPIFDNLDIGYAVDDSLPENTVRLDYGTGHVDFEATWDEHGMHLHRKEPYLLADIEAPQPGDEFPNVGYVRRMLALLDGAHNRGERRSA